VSQCGRKQQGAEHALSRGEGIKREVSEPNKREQSTHSLDARGIKKK
jgi:hypothetical protein